MPDLSFEQEIELAIFSMEREQGPDKALELCEALRDAGFTSENGEDNEEKSR